MKDVILHVAADTPSSFDVRPSTVAIGDAISSLGDRYENFLLVPKRQHRPQRMRVLEHADQLHVSLFDPGSWVGIGVERRLDWASFVEQMLLKGKRPVAVHSHKLSYDARIGSVLSRYFGVPHIVTIRGHSDTHSRNLFPWAINRYSDILMGSAANLWLSAWAAPVIQAKVGYRMSEKDILFPSCVPDGAAHGGVERTRETTGSRMRFVCVARLTDLKQKGILDLIEGLADAVSLGSDVVLDMIGEASAESEMAIREATRALGVSDRVNLLGKMPRSDVLARLSTYDALVLTSVSETFGLVYLEALFSGCPFIYRAGSGVDGHYFAEEFGVRAESGAPQAVSAAIEVMCRESGAIQARIRDALLAGRLDYLTATGMRKRYADIFEAVVKK